MTFSIIEIKDSYPLSNEDIFYYIGYDIENVKLQKDRTYQIYIGKNYVYLAKISNLKKLTLKKLSVAFLNKITNNTSKGIDNFFKSNSRTEIYKIICSVYNIEFDYETQEFFILKFEKVYALTEIELCKEYNNHIIPIQILKNLSVLGDIFRIFPLLPDNCFKIIIIDPPYNISQKRTFVRDNTEDLKMDFGGWDHFGEGIEGVENYLNFIFKLINECHRLLAEDGTIYLFCSDTYNSFIEHYFKYTLKMFFKATFVWAKYNPPPRFMKRSFAHSTEFCLIAQKDKEKATFNFKKQNQMRNFLETGLVGGNERLKRWSKSKDKEITLHPTQKPKQLIRKFLRVSSNEFDLTADLFAGTFTSSTVAKEENRFYFSIEKKYLYFKYGVKRVIETKVREKDNEDNEENDDSIKIEKFEKKIKNHKKQIEIYSKKITDLNNSEKKQISILETIKKSRINDI